MSNAFFDGPILNSPYEYPARHWELDADDGRIQVKIKGVNVFKPQTGEVESGERRPRTNCGS